VLSAIYLLTSYLYVWIVLTAAGLILLVFWHAKATAYHCPRCGYEFEISLFTDFLSPHGVNKEGGWKYLKCPSCHHRSRMEILVKKKGVDCAGDVSTNRLLALPSRFFPHLP
jgi:DNA-directed RNA polymerase subunit RPC12/RpoP